MESRRPYVSALSSLRWRGGRTDNERNGRLTGHTLENSYNRYLAVAARVVRRSLKEEQRLAAERRGQMDLRFAKWTVRLFEEERRGRGRGEGLIRAMHAERQDGRAPERGGRQCEGVC